MHGPAPFLIRMTTWLFRIFRIPRRHEILFDLDERFEQRLRLRGLLPAWGWLTGQTLQILAGALKNTLFWSTVMFKNYIRIALRNTAKQKLYMLITLSGLICGLAIYLLIQLSGEVVRRYDQFHEKGQRIYSVVQVLPGGQDGPRHSAMTPPPLAPELASAIPDIEKATRYLPAGPSVIRHADKVFHEGRIYFVDAAFLQLFDFPLIRGDRHQALSQPNAVLISKEAAQKYFGDANPMGQTLTLNGQTRLTVTGVLDELPVNTSLRFQFLVSMPPNPQGFQADSWTQRNQAAYLLLREGVEAETLTPKLEAFREQFIPQTAESPTRLYLLPLHRQYLNSEHIENCWSNGQVNFTVMHILSILALLIACINYMNLSTARFIKRANEVGLRKVIGATRPQLIVQFLSESVVLALLAFPLSLALFSLIKPLYMQYIDSTFRVSLGDYPSVLIKALATAVITGLVSGLYPALYLSSFTPIKVLQGKLNRSKTGGRIRKILVVAQFFFSILFVVLTLVSLKQSRHNLSVDLGFNRKNILAVQLPTTVRDRADLLRQEIMRQSGVTAISAAQGLPVSWDPQQEVLPHGRIKHESIKMDTYEVDNGFTGIFDIALLQGEPFSEIQSQAHGVLLNETAVRQLGWQDPLGRELMIAGKTYVVQGVTQDYHFRSIAFENVLPSVLLRSSAGYRYLLVKYQEGTDPSALENAIQEHWKILMPDQPFETVDVDEYWTDINIRDDKTVQFSGALGLIAILLSCLGLFGLTAFTVERRIKEIGVRKVLGAGEMKVILLLSRDFLKLVALANVIALPIAYLLINKIVHFIFVYPVPLGPMPFIIAAVSTLGVAFATVGSLTLRAARLNVARALRYE